MLDMVSWGQFALVVFLFTLVYYGLVLSFFYRGQLETWFRPKASEFVPKVLPLHAGGLMGLAKPHEEGVELASAEELDFAEVEEEVVEAKATIGKAVVDELRELIGYAAGAKENKQGLLTLLALYLERADISQRRELAVMMLETCKGKFDFSLSLADLELGDERDEGMNTGLGGSLEKGMLAIILMLCYETIAWAQDGNSGIAEATSKVRSYFATGCNLMYAIGAVIGLIGAVKVYQKWNGGDGDTGKVAASWFGSCIFLVVVATVLQSFFGI